MASRLRVTIPRPSISLIHAMPYPVTENVKDTVRRLSSPTGSVTAANECRVPRTDRHSSRLPSGGGMSTRPPRCTAPLSRKTSHSSPSSVDSMKRHRLSVDIWESKWCGSVMKAVALSMGQRTWRETVIVWAMSPDHRHDGLAGQLRQPDLHDAGEEVGHVVPIRFVAEPGAQIDRLEHLHPN